MCFLEPPPPPPPAAAALMRFLLVHRKRKRQSGNLKASCTTTRRSWRSGAACILLFICSGRAPFAAGPAASVCCCRRGRTKLACRRQNKLETNMLTCDIGPSRSLAVSFGRDNSSHRDLFSSPRLSATNSAPVSWPKWPRQTNGRQRSAKKNIFCAISPAGCCSSVAARFLSLKKEEKENRRMTLPT